MFLIFSEVYHERSSKDVLKDKENVCVSNFECMQRKDYEGIIVPTALYGAETWNVGAAEMKRSNV